MCGLRSVAVQKQLLAQTDLMLDKALQIAQGMEAAEKSTKTLQGGDNSSYTSQINRMRPSRGSSRQSTKLCYHCGHTDHIASACRFREARCNKCHKKGHLVKVCQSGQKNPDQQQSDLPRQSRNTTGRRRRPRGTSRRAFTIREPECGDELLVLRVGGKSVRPIMIEITINGKKTQMELDTGAAVSIISTKTKAKLFPEEPLTDSSLVLTTYSGEQLQVAGQMLVNVKYGRQHNQLPVYVIKGNSQVYWVEIGFRKLH